MANRNRFIAHESLGITYAGELSFLRALYTRDIEGADVVVSGIPFDSAVSFRSGARLGPQAIRAASVQLGELLPHAFPFGFNPLKELAVADYGDCKIDYGHPEEMVASVEKHADTLIASGATMVSLGGDHFVTYPLLRAHARKYGPLSLVHFDAHVDTWEDDGNRLDHGSMFLRAKRENLIDTTRSVQIGIRSFSDSDHGFTVLNAPTVHSLSIADVCARIIEVVGDSPAYLTFDIDCLDPAFAPGTGTPVPGGLSSAQALGILRGIGALNYVGMDVVEVAPAYDHAEITAIAAATIAHDFIGLLAQKRRGQ